TRAWQARIEGLGRLPVEPRRQPLPPREPALAVPGGSDPPTDPSAVVRNLLEAHGVDRAVLLPLTWLNALADSRIANAYASAFNDHFVHEWLPADPRFALVISVAPHDPEAAAGEIRRHAAV